LLVVIAILALLLTIIGPSVLQIRQTGASVVTEGRISLLSRAAEQYKQYHQYYPGVRHLVAGKDYQGDASWAQTGSQVLALSIFSPEDDAGQFPGDSRYCSSYEANLLFTYEDEGDSYPNTLSSGPEDTAPICYYPADPRMADQGAKQYAFKHNKAYTGSDSDAFYEFITDGGDQDDPAWRSNAFLLIAPGPDGTYFTQDDITNE
jgi:type II secretory pathway pseudopilin PulG